jgi:hypothetical protein
MYEDFHVTDRWSGEDLQCRWSRFHARQNDHRLLAGRS